MASWQGQHGDLPRSPASTMPGWPVGLPPERAPRRWAGTTGAGGNALPATSSGGGLKLNCIWCYPHCCGGTAHHERPRRLRFTRRWSPIAASSSAAALVAEPARVRGAAAGEVRRPEGVRCPRTDGPQLLRRAAIKGRRRVEGKIGEEISASGGRNGSAAPSGAAGSKPGVPPGKQDVQKRVKRAPDYNADADAHRSNDGPRRASIMSQRQGGVKAAARR